MYCKECGKVIADNSKFCQHCGASQIAQQVVSEPKKEKVKESKVVEIPIIKSNFSEKTKWIIFAYSTWLLLNFYWLFAGNKSSSASNYLIPLSKRGFDLRYYDITEFVLYIIGIPLAIWGIMMINKNKDNKSSSIQSK